MPNSFVFDENPAAARPLALAALPVPGTPDASSSAETDDNTVPTAEPIASAAGYDNGAPVQITT